MEPLFDPQRYIRDYFDLGDEFDFASNEDKLLEIANCVYHGFNLYKALKEHCEEHPERKSSFCLKLTEYIEMIRGGKNGTITHLYGLNQYTLEQLVYLFKEEVLRLYRFPRHGKPYFASVKEYYNPDFIKQFIKKDIDGKMEQLGYPTPFVKIPITEEELREINPWDGSEQYVKPIESVTTLYDEEAKCVLKCDEPYIKEFNERHKIKGSEYKYRLQKWPKPFVGNPLTSKVILLSLNPAFKERTHRMVASIMNNYYSEAINKQLLDQMSFDTPSMFCPNTKPGDFKMTYLEAQAMVDNWYWYDKIENFRRIAGLSRTNMYHDPLYNDFSVIEYVGYASSNYDDAPNNRIFPSQNFTKLLIQYLTYYTKKVIVVTRSENRWHNFIGDEMWSILEQEGRLILGRNIRIKNLNKKGLGEEDFNRLVNSLK